MSKAKKLLERFDRKVTDYMPHGYWRQVQDKIKGMSPRKQRDFIGQDFEDRFDGESYPALPMLGDDWGMGLKLDSPNDYYDSALKVLRRKYGYYDNYEE